MTFRRKRQMIASLMAAVIAVGTMSGCASSKTAGQIEKMEVEKSTAISFDIIGGKDVMPIGAYYIPYSSIYSYNGNDLPNYISDEFYAKISDSGINLLMHSVTDYSDAPNLVKQNLDLGAKYNIGVLVDDAKITGQAGQETISKEDITTRLSEYMNHPGFAGLYVTDEPTTEYTYTIYNEMNTIERYGKLSQMLNDEVGIFCYTNAFHSGGSDKEKAVYERYIEDIYNSMHPQYLSFDRYVFDKTHEKSMRNFFYDLEIMRKVSQKYNVPFWTYIAAGSQWNDGMTRFDSETPYYPDEGQFDWSVNVALAFGAQGIQYFPLIQPHFFAWAETTEFDFERNGIFGAWGNKTQWYYYAQDMNKHIAAIDEVLMNSVNKGVIASGEKAIKETSYAETAIIDGTAWRELESVNGDALIGCFNYQGKTALYVANYSYDYAQEVELKFNDNYNFTVIQNAETKQYTGKGITLDMYAGDGVLIVFE